MGIHRRLPVCIAITCCAVLLAALRASAAENPPEVRSATTVGASGISESVSDVMRRQAAREAEGELERDVEEEIEQPDRSGLPQNPASPEVAQTPALPPDLKPHMGDVRTLSPQTVGVNFTGATLLGINPTLSFPPDCMGAVGPSQYVVFVNGRLVTFNKATGLADGVLNVDPDVFFQSVRNGSGTSDPRIRYDRLTGRWILVIINVSTPNRILIAVSDAASANALSGGTLFTFFFIPIDSTPPAISVSCLADYPTLGVDANALYIGTDNFCGAPQTFNSTDGYVVRKSSVLGAGPIVITAFRGLVATTTAVGPYAPQGVDNLDPAATEGYFIGVDNASFGTLQLRRVANPGGTPTISSNVPITVATTRFPLRVPHLGNTGGLNGQLSALDDRLFAAHIRNGRLWTAHNIGVNNTGVSSGTLTRDGSRWYELNVPVGSGTPTVLQSGTVFTASGTNLNDQRYYWIPSVMVSGQGHAALGFSTAGANERANCATVGRLLGDVAGTMQAPVLFTNSTTAYNPPSDPGGANGRRWGDYTYTSLDPLDDQTMWTVQEFCDTGNSYGVRIAKLIAPPPALPSALADVSAGQNPVAVMLTGTSAAGSGYFDPGVNLPGVPPFSHLTVSSSAGSATGTPPVVLSATYVNPTMISLSLNAASATPNLPGEKYTVTVTNPDGQSAAAAVLHVVGTVPVANLAAGPTQVEGNGGTTTFAFTVNLSSAATAPVTISYQTANGTATTADNDYVAASGSIPIAVGNSSGTINVTVNGDLKFEADETFTVTLTGATNATLGSPLVATGTITNDDPEPVISIAPTVSALEGNAGLTPVSCAVSLSNPSGFPVTAHFTTADGSATVADNDYMAANGNVNLPENALSGSVQLSVNGDLKHESNETIQVVLSAPTGATLGNAVSTVTVQNDDLPPSVSINHVTLAEGNAGTQAFSFTVSLSAPSGLPASVDFNTADGSATLADLDYQSATGTLGFAPGVVTQPVAVLVNGDLTQELDETFLVQLSNLVNLQAGVPSGTGTILNDDAVPVLSIGDVTLPEGDTGTTAFVFTVSLSHTSDQTLSVQFQTQDGTATLANSDYQNGGGTLNIPPHATSAPITVLVNGDSCGEPSEAFSVVLSNPSGAALGTATATGTIQNDDDAAPPTVTVQSPNGGEILTAGTTADLQWNASDNLGVTSVDLLLSRDGGGSFPEVLASGISNSGSFSWTVTGPAASSAQAVLQVRAHDGGCNTASDESDEPFRISDVVSAVPEGTAITDFALGAIRPNPTAATAEIEFLLPRESTVTLTILDVRGREVATLIDGRISAGRHSVTWNGRGGGRPAARGVYLVRYTAGGKEFHSRLVLTR